MNINLVPDSSVSSAPAGFIAAVQAAANAYDQDFPGNYTANIRYGWGTYNNAVDSELTGVAESFGGIIGASYNISYSTIKGWLANNATLADQQAALASLPADSSTLPGAADAFVVSSAQEKALGVYDGASGDIDGATGFGTISTSADWLPEALVEIGHALGWMTNYYVGAPTILDLFRYASPGQNEWTGGQPAYFSTDGGQTNLGNFATTFDYTLFTGIPNETFEVFTTFNTSLTALDLEVMHVIGFGGSPETATVEAVSNDFNGDGTSDLIWQYKGSGAVAEWSMLGGQHAADTILGTLPTADWQLIGTGDFNGDGTDDLLWQDKDNGAVAEWGMQNGQHVSDTILGTLPTSDWQLIGTGDFNGDGTADLLWQNTGNGAVAEWGMQNGQHATDILLGTMSRSEWQLIGAGDCNGDGTADLLWQDKGTGEVDEWGMQNGQHATNTFLGYLPAADWQLIGTGDYNGDKTADLLWRNRDNGAIAEWGMQNGQHATDTILGILPASTWQAIPAITIAAL